MIGTCHLALARSVAPLYLPEEQAVAALVRVCCWALHDKKERKDIDDDPFAAHYQSAPKTRVPPTVLGEWLSH